MPDIIVPIDETLKKRMDREQEENWAQVATRAFEQRLAELFQKRTLTDMDAAIQRLRASRQDSDQSANGEGYRAGRRWAESAASFDQLKRLCELTDQLDSGHAGSWRDLFANNDVNALSTSDIVACYIQGQPPNRDLARDFWRSTLERFAPPEPEFLHDFAEGATEIYHAVADKL